MPPRPKTPPPIDRPLSKAYLREFIGWSTAYPPGLSAPNSLRDMVNVLITREGGARVRPGLRSMMRERSPFPLVGSFELFYNADGSKAYLVALREADAITFRVLVDPDGQGYVMQTLAEAGFDIMGDESSIAFSPATTYVRYLQIDNKIFALSNGPEPMVMFWVGADKKAQRLAAITRPAWTVDDKLTVVHPETSWVLNTEPASTRTNLCLNPSFEKSTRYWREDTGRTWMGRVAGGHVGSHSLRIRSEPMRINYCTRPLGDVAKYGAAGWSEGPRCFNVERDGTSLKIRLDRMDGDLPGYAISERFAVPGGKRIGVAFDLVDESNIRRWSIAVRYFKANGDSVGGTETVGSGTGMGAGRKRSDTFLVPEQASSMRVLIGGYTKTAKDIPLLRVNDVFVGDFSEGSDRLHGDQAGDNYWVGTPNDSMSVYHPPRDVVVATSSVGGSPGSYRGSAHIDAPTAKTVQVQVRAKNSSGTVIASSTDTSAHPGTWTRLDSGVFTAPDKTVTVDLRVIVRDVARSQLVHVDGVLLERGATLRDYFSGSTKDTGLLKYEWAGTAEESRSIEKTFNVAGTGFPSAETPTARTLISSDPAKNVYSLMFYYTFSNELGESAESQTTVVKVQRAWPRGWLWERPNAAGEPSGNGTRDPDKCADQLVAGVPQDVFAEAIAAGATTLNFYVATWGPNDAPPVTAQKFAEIPLTEDSVFGTSSQARLTPQNTKIGLYDPPIPTERTRVNSTDPSRGSQGLVAADRLILVGDPEDPARITWSSGVPGRYHDFSPLLGGGSKQLTSGNLYLTACVKLWQNPQSVDTLTILNLGDDGRSNAYYMQPAEITTMSESISVMGFEEVSAIRGTSSPYGCEVVNNGLYHPLRTGVMKSTANNYNISSKPVTDDIENVWQALQSHHRIVSAVLDNRIYYLVHNRLGETLEPDCWGNEVWVLDIAAKTPAWSRWRAQGCSLRSVEFGGKLMMALVRPDGIFGFDHDRANDEVFGPDGVLFLRNIRWHLETNTQGANRAHDAWANVQQVNAMLGNFEGQIRYGVRSKDIHGMDVDISKVVLATNPPKDGLPDDAGKQPDGPPVLRPTDRHDYLLIRKMLMEWTFYASSVDDVVPGKDGAEVLEARFSAGQISLVQYRYTPVTVNVGYEYGSVETFEYGSSAAADATTDSGVPKPYIDLGTRG